MIMAVVVGGGEPVAVPETVAVLEPVALDDAVDVADDVLAVDLCKTSHQQPPSEKQKQ